jgi:toxin ParE1/3/4
MKLRIVKHRRAKRDLLLTYVYIGEHNMTAAEQFLRAVAEDARKLAEMPGMGALRSFENPKLAGVRSWPVTGFRNYLIFYRANDVQLQVLRVLHGARDIDAVFANEPL